MMLHHDWIVQVLAAAHCVGKVHFPIVAVIHIAHGRGHAALRHNRVRLAKKGFTNHSNFQTRGGRLNGGAQTSATGANDKHVMFVHDELLRKTHRILQSVQVPLAHMRT